MVEPGNRVEEQLWNILDAIELLKQRARDSDWLVEDEITSLGLKVWQLLVDINPNIGPNQNNE